MNSQKVRDVHGQNLCEVVSFIVEDIILEKSLYLHSPKFRG